MEKIFLSLAIIVASIVALIIVLIFRTELKDLLRRLVRVGPQGAELTPPTQQVIADAAEQAPARALSQQPIAYNPGLAPWELELDTIIEREGLRDSPKLTAQLKNALALTKRLLDFHTAARLVFGTQIAALKLMGSNSTGLSLNDLRPIFQEHEARFASAGIDLRPDILAWINFLVGQRLVSYEGGRYKITAAGIDFLAFASELGINESKSF